METALIFTTILSSEPFRAQEANNKFPFILDMQGLFSSLASLAMGMAWVVGGKGMLNWEGFSVIGGNSSFSDKVIFCRYIDTWTHSVVQNEAIFSTEEKETC